MDLDVMHRHVTDLRRWKEKLDKLLDPPMLDRLTEMLAGAEEASKSPFDDLSKRVDEMGEHVAVLEQKLDAIGDVMGMLKDMHPRLVAVEKLADPAVIDLLDWLARNREAIDVLTSLGSEDVGDDNPASGGAPAPGGQSAPGASAEAASAGTGDGGTVGSQAAPGSQEAPATDGENKGG